MGTLPLLRQLSGAARQLGVVIIPEGVSGHTKASEGTRTRPNRSACTKSLSAEITDNWLESNGDACLQYHPTELNANFP